MDKFKEVLDYLSKKEWRLDEDWKESIKFLEDKIKEDIDMEERKSIKRYIKIFKEPLTFEHDLTTYKTGRIFSKYVLLPNKDVCGINFKSLIVPRKGYVFVSFDFSASQIRHMAVLYDIEWLKEMFKKDLDVYVEYAKETGIEERKTAKIIMLLLSFGGSRNTIENKFGEILSEEKIDKAIEVYDDWFKTKGKKYKERVQLNYEIQKEEVEFFKKKMYGLYKTQGKKYMLHAFIHDDIIVEVHKEHLDQIPKIKRYLERYKKVTMKTKVSVSESFKFK